MTSSTAIERRIADETLKTPLGERAYKVCEILIDAGYEAHWVGGGVREMLLGHVPTDIDIATSALPDEVLGCFKRSKAEEQSKKLGSVRVMFGDDEIEITTFREDDEASDGRHPESVTFTTDRAKDAKRRDFTINALYWNPVTQEFYDPFNGVGDLHERLIRFIGEPGIRIKHDGLRLLRAVRLRATIDGQFHPETYVALRELSEQVEGLSPQRIALEFEKMLLSEHPERALEDLWELGILARILPELHACKGIPQPADYHREGDVWDHTMQCLKNFTAEHAIDVRIAALFHDCGKVKTFSLKERIRFDHHASISADLATGALKRLQFTKKTIEKIDWLIRHHMSMTFPQMPDERKTHWYHHPWFNELLQLFWLDIAGTTPSNYGLLNSIIADYHKYLDSHPAPAKALLTGSDVMEILGIQEGAEVGRILQALHSEQTKGTIGTKKEAKAFLETIRCL